MKNKLKEKPTNVEDLTGLKDYLNNELNNEIEKIKKNLFTVKPKTRRKGSLHSTSLQAPNLSPLLGVFET